MPTRRELILRGLAATAALPLLAFAARAGGLAPPPMRPVSPIAPPARPAMGAVHAVEIRGFAFIPARLTVAPGDTVLFTNRDAAPHTATSESGLFDSGRLGAGQSARMAFSARGTYPYLCSIHPKMRGVVTVA
ncbi:cupredoxin domain-containing protein [Limimaricola litoreus]|uniref:Cupredoxin family copper-binding protein n=1 Tax=Limimaricola litoreus TaxID=2955316 RepID=A0A9X2FXA5_9RHOB|nr:cupredoxin family copper-binding protein [Limimaricola litoreus]MCP1168858.1 cupredoxin family copper-binding protein [Limimaricola litoreus]